jgi:hypothetical protein
VGETECWAGETIAGEEDFQSFRRGCFGLHFHLGLISSNRRYGTQLQSRRRRRQLDLCKVFGVGQGVRCWNRHRR